MKKMIFSIAALVLVLALLAGCASTPPAASPIPVTDAATGSTTVAVPTVTVSGEGKVKVEPDMATVNFGVEVINKTNAEEATKTVSDAMDAVKAKLISLGVKEEDMQTAYFSMYESYQYDSNGNRIGKPLYNASNSLIVKLYDIDNAGKIIDEAHTAGATNTNGITFGLKDPTAQENEALALAFENAKGRAQALCTAASKQVGDVLLLSDSTEVGEIYYENAPKAMAAAADSGMRSVSLTPGTLELTARVSVRFTMK